MPKKTLFLHIGMPKCATTSIQHMLDVAAREGRLAEHGLRFPVHPREPDVSQGNATILFYALFHKRWDEVRRLLDVFLEGEGDVVLSSEMMIALGRNAKIAPVFDIIAERGFDLRVVCFLRRQDHWIESDYKQHVKGGGTWIPTLGELIAYRGRTRALDYAWALENWQRLVGRERMYVSAIVEGDAPEAAPHRFAEIIGCPEALRPYYTLPSLNVSPPAGLIEPGRLLRRAHVTGGYDTETSMALLTRFFRTAPDLVTVPQRRFLMPAAARRALLQEFAESNARLAETFGGGVPLFPDEVREDPASEAPLEEEADRVLAEYMIASDEEQAPAASLRSKVETGLRALRRTAWRLGPRW